MQNGSNRTHCKIPGITQNYNSKPNVNFGVLKHFATKCQNATVSVVNARQKQIKDNNVPTKDYQILFYKIVIGANYVSYPYYGY